MNKLQATLRVVPLLAVCLLAQGCVGFVVARTKTETFKNPRIWRVPSLTAVSTNYSTNVATAAWLRDHWGRPASVRPASTQSPAERWTYKFRIACYGVIPCVIVPVPLVVPATRQKVVFDVQEGRVVGADVVKSHFSGVFWQPLGPDAYPVGFAGW